LSIVFTWVTGLRAEVISGEVKNAAVEAQLLTLQASDSRLLLVSWDKKTVFRNLKNPAEIKADDYLLVDFSLQGEQLLASAITAPETILPPGIAAATFALIDKFVDSSAAEQSLVLIDIRPPFKYDAGHIPGARSIPLARIAKRTAGLLPENRNATIIFYDEGVIVDAAVQAAQQAKKNGYANVLVLKEGVRGWVRSGRFLASSASFIRKSKPALIDLRAADKVHQGHIETAVNYPLDVLAAMDGNILLNARTPIVVYGETDQDALAAGAIIRKWGYRNVTYFRGGAAAWQNGAEALETGPAVDSIPAEEDNHSGGMLPFDEFRNAVTSTQTIQVVDVRSDDDYRSGHLPAGIHIPLRNITERYKELDREKIQVVFAADAGRAEMAYDFLKSKGYRVKFLGSPVQFSSDGTYTVK
jgi:rhodanese-related sulfurtransferase